MWQRADLYGLAVHSCRQGHQGCIRHQQLVLGGVQQVQHALANQPGIKHLRGSNNMGRHFYKLCNLECPSVRKWRLGVNTRLLHKFRIHVKGSKEAGGQLVCGLTRQQH